MRKNIISNSENRFYTFKEMRNALKTMKVILCLLCISIGTVFASSSYAEKTIFSIEMKEKTVSEVLEAIEEQTDFHFFYNSKLIDMDRRISIDLQNKDVFTVLDHIFKESGVKYKVIEKDVILTTADIDTNTTPATPIVQQQQRQVTGKVVDAFNAPLPGVAVVVKGTTNGTVTDVDGRYTLSVPQGESLVFSYIGFVNQEKQVVADVMNIVLLEDIQQLEEVVVVGYGVQRKSDVTGAIAKVEVGDIQNRSITDANQALYGKTAGVQLVSSAGSPGTQTDVMIRGISSNSGSSPLYIVDGMQVRSINFIEPNNIESMEVLKDAASAAIYGAQAGNGVILITTKKGSGSVKGTITYDGQFVFNDITRIPDRLNAQDYQQYMLEGGYITQNVFDQYWDGKTDTDWSDVAFNTGFSQRHNVSFSQASDQGTFFSSLSYQNQDGPVIGNRDVFRRWSFFVNADRNIKNWLKMGINFTYSRNETRSVGSGGEYGNVLGSVLLLDPLTPVYWPTMNDLPEAYKPYVDNGMLMSDENGYYAQSLFFNTENPNPLTIVNRNLGTGYNNSTLGTAFLNFIPVKELVITSRLSMQLNNRMGRSYSTPYYANTISTNANPTLSRSATESFYYQWENFANYTKRFDKHDVNAMVGMSFSQTHTENLSTGANRLLNDNPLYRDFSWLHPDATRTISGGYSDAAQYSYFGRINYTYDNKYMLQTTLRADAFDSSKLSKESRYGYFPAFSAGWNMHNENFMKGISFLSSLKLRASWGQNGSIRALNNYQHVADMTTAANRRYDFTSNPASLVYTNGYYPSRLSNPSLKWETSTQLNIGIDSRFFNNRLTLTFDWYEKNTNGLLVSATPPLFTGFGSMWINGGDVKNSGFEFDFGWNDYIGDFRYSVKANLATLKNKVTYLDPSITRINGTGFFLTSDFTVFEEGYPIWYMRGYELDGIDSSTGDPVFKDHNDDGLINNNDKTMIGSGLPDFTYGITLNAAWKGFDLTVFGNGSQGNDMYMCLFRNDKITSNRLQFMFDERWHQGNTNATRLKAGSTGFDNYIQSTGMIFDGSFFKIKQIQFGYVLPKKLLDKIKVNNIRFYVSLDDFFSFTKYPGFDPEVSTNTRTSQDEVTGSGIGIDKGAYPIYRKTTFGLNVTF